jgi:PAS domain S-box-containing protein
LIEDCVEHALLNIRALKAGGLDVQAERVETEAELKDALETKTWDFILSDYHLPGFGGQEALQVYKDSGLDIPFIIVSGLIGEEQAVKLIKSGAHDYVTKDDLAKLAPAVKRELEAAEERLIRRRACETESFLVSVVRDCNDAIIGQTLDGHIVSWNTGAETLYGYTASEALGRLISLLESPHRPAEHPRILERLKQGERIHDFETVHARKDGNTIDVSLSISPIKQPGGRIIGFSTIAQDIKLRKQEEAERLALIQDLASALAEKTQQKQGNPVMQ